MLQRAASNAYSWWWASHIRTKQSKWLEHNLQDMEEKVDYTLKIIDHDGDTFAKRAEMYYRKRPEIVNFVEESFRSYRALAERYDHLSRELQSANRTIATAFPEHIPFSLDDDDEEDEDKQPKHLHLIPKNGGSNIPQVPEIPKKDFRGHPLLLSRKGPQYGLKRIMPSSAMVATSGLTREEALDEIDKVQKGILALQTEKEFVRSSYENSYDRYWQLEDEITEMQKRVCVLQDEFGVGAEIDDSEARALMASTALNTCKETISKLEEKQKQSLEEAEIEKERIAAAKERFEALRRKFDKPEGLRFKTEEVEDVSLQEPGTESVRELNKVDPSENLTVVQLVEKIDELVEKVVSLETTASSNTALVKTLRSETDELHEHIRGLEKDKAALVSDSAETKKRITSLEEELSNVKSLFQRVEEQNKTLQKHFKEANITVEDLSDKLQGVKMDEGVEGTELSDSITKETGPWKSEEGKDDQKAEAARERPRESTQQHEKPETKDSCAMSETASTCFGTEQEDQVTEDEDLETPNWRQLLPDGMEDREKVILDEYTSVLRDYREVKRKLSDVEKKNRDGFFELALQIRELKNALAYKDVEIQSLHQKFVTPDKDSSPRPVEGNHSDLEGPCESMNISPISSFSAFTTPHQQGGDQKTPARTRQGEIRVKFADTDDSPRTKIPTVEEKVRSDIDTILEENLEFWLRFSTSVHQLQKYQTTVQDLKSELSKLKIESRKQHDSSTNPGNSSHSLASEARPIYRHLREIRTELQLWLENSAVLRDELQGRYASLCNIQDEISRVTSHSGSGKASDAEISGYQAAKFHGEILNMKQENRKVSSEMQTGLDRVKTLKNDVERVLSTMEEDLGFSRANDTRMQNKSSSTGRPRIPLRSFLFGVKLKRQKQQKQSASASLFSCVSPSPALHKQNSYVNPPQNLPE